MCYKSENEGLNRTGVLNWDNTVTDVQDSDVQCKLFHTLRFRKHQKFKVAPLLLLPVLFLLYIYTMYPVHKSRYYKAYSHIAWSVPNSAVFLVLYVDPLMIRWFLLEHILCGPYHQFYWSESIVYAYICS